MAVLLAIFFSATGDAISSGLSQVQALKAGLARVQEVGGAEPGDRTMIDALTPALDALPDGFVAAAKAARDRANNTADIVQAKAGRASYISEDRLRGHNDPGAEAVARLFESLVSAHQSCFERHATACPYRARRSCSGRGRDRRSTLPSHHADS